MKHSKNTTHVNIRGIEICTIIYNKVLFICNCNVDAEKLEWALSSLNDILFQW